MDRPPARLLVAKSADGTRYETSGRFVIESDVTTIGRSPSADVVLADIRISRRHARIVWSPPAGFVLIDDSVNGFKVDGVSVGRERELRDEAVVELSSRLRVVFFSGDGAATRLARYEADLTSWPGLPRDPLTWLLAPRGQHAVQAAVASTAGPLPPVLFLVQVDETRTLMDIHGSSRGDELLRVVAKRLRGQASPTAPALRVAYASFALFEAAPDPLRRRGELEVALSRTAVPAFGRRYPVVLRVSATSLVPGEAADTWRRRADTAAKAKRPDARVFAVTASGSVHAFESLPIVLATSGPADVVLGGTEAARRHASVEADGAVAVVVSEGGLLVDGRRASRRAGLGAHGRISLGAGAGVWLAVGPSAARELVRRGPDVLFSGEETRLLALLLAVDDGYWRSRELGAGASTLFVGRALPTGEIPDAGDDSRALSLLRAWTTIRPLPVLLARDGDRVLGFAWGLSDTDAARIGAALAAASVPEHAIQFAFVRSAVLEEPAALLLRLDEALAAAQRPPNGRDRRGETEPHPGFARAEALSTERVPHVRIACLLFPLTASGTGDPAVAREAVVDALRERAEADVAPVVAFADGELGVLFWRAGPTESEWLIASFERASKFAASRGGATATWSGPFGVALDERGDARALARAAARDLARKQGAVSRTLAR